MVAERMQVVRKHIHATVQRLVAASRYSNQEIAALALIPAEEFNEFLAGQRSLTVEELYLVSRALKVDMSELFSGLEFATRHTATRCPPTEA